MYTGLNSKIFIRLILVCLFFLLSVMPCTAQTPKRYSIKFNNTNLEQSIKLIRDRFNINFFYNPKLVSDERKLVSKTLINSTIEEIMDVLTDGTELSYTYINNVIIIFKKNDKERVSHTVLYDSLPMAGGIVLDKHGDPVIAANVVIVGTNAGTYTDNNGRFIIGLPPDGILQISAISYKTRVVKYSGDRFFVVVLDDLETLLSELIVIGYGTRMKANLTGAVQQIKAENIAFRPSSDISFALQGLMPGLNIKRNTGDPRNPPEINIRGFNSVNGGSPLIMIDGIEGNLSLINPADIESITVLKDAGSSAIYGARGSFGVILVTTRRGKDGDISIAYNNNYGWTKPTVRTDFISDPYLHAKLCDAGIYGYNGTSFTNYNQQDWITIQQVARGEIEPFYETMPNGNKKFFYSTNWHKYLFRRWQPTQNHNVSVSGGTEKFRGYFSARKFLASDYNNIAPGKFERFNIKTTLDYNVFDWLELSANSQFNTAKEIEYGGTATGFGNYLSASTYLTYYSWQPNFIDGIPFHPAMGNAAAMEGKNNWRTRNFEQYINTIRAKLKPAERLEINADISNRINYRSVATRLNKFQYYSDNRVVLVTQGLNRLSESREKTDYTALNVYGTYWGSIDNRHNYKIMMGYNREFSIYNQILGEKSDLLYQQISNFSVGTKNLTLTGSANHWSIEGLFGRLNYDFKERYLLEINARRDGSSRFPHNSRWGFFPSVSAGWYISREPFWDSMIHSINTLKIRVSYGKLGNQSVDLYTFLQTIPMAKTTWLFNGNREYFASVPSPLPSEVTWEETKSLDVGIDIGFLNNKLVSTFDWYEKRTDGMYVTGQPLPAVFGAPSPRVNLAGLSNKGFEFSLIYNNSFTVSRSPLMIRATFSIFNYVAYITEFPNPDGLMSTYWKGQKLGDIWGYKIDGQFQTDEEARAYYQSFSNPGQQLGQVYSLIVNNQNLEWKTLRAGDIKYVDRNNDGEISRGKYTIYDHGDLEVIGNALPKFPFGFSFSADWKNFDISFAGNGVVKQHWTPGGVTYWGHYDRPQASFIRKDLIKQAWDPDNPGGRYPQIYRGYTALGPGRMLYTPNSYYLENVGYLRVKNLTVGYSLPHKLLDRVKIKNLRIYFSGENLFTVSFGGLTKYIDPEQAGSGIGYNNPSDATGRSEVEEYPYGKTYSFGLSIQL